MFNLGVNKGDLAPGAFDDLAAMELESCDSVSEIMTKVRTGKF